MTVAATAIGDLRRVAHQLDLELPDRASETEIREALEQRRDDLGVDLAAILTSAGRFPTATLLRLRAVTEAELAAVEQALGVTSPTPNGQRAHPSGVRKEGQQ